MNELNYGSLPACKKLAEVLAKSVNANPTDALIYLWIWVLEQEEKP